MKYLMLLLLFVAGTVNAQTPKWSCDSYVVKYVKYATDEWDEDPGFKTEAKGCTVSFFLGTTSGNTDELMDMTHVVAKFTFNGSTKEQVFQLGRFDNLRQSPADDDIFEYVWFDEEHGDYYIISCFNEDILSFRTLSTGNRTGLYISCSGQYSRT